MLQFIYSTRVYYEDTDAIGIVYHANYLKFFERARVEGFREQGYLLKDLLEHHNTQFVVHSLSIKFLLPAYLDQLLYIVTTVAEVNFASIRYNQKAYLDSKEGSILCEADIRVACINSQHQVRRLPEFLVGEFKK